MAPTIERAARRRPAERDGSMHATHAILPLAAAFFVFLHAGCSKEVKPGVTCEVFFLAKGDDGTVSTRGPATRIESATVHHVQEIAHEGQALSLLVRKTEYGKAMFEITFPDNETQRVRIEVGETRDVLPKGQKIGLRIAVQDCH
jgi:hypothetical protein